MLGFVSSLQSELPLEGLGDGGRTGYKAGRRHEKDLGFVFYLAVVLLM